VRFGCQYKAFDSVAKALSITSNTNSELSRTIGGVRVDKLWGIRGVFTCPMFTGIATVEGTSNVWILPPFAGRELMAFSAVSRLVGLLRLTSLRIGDSGAWYISRGGEPYNRHLPCKRPNF
jgi:hypothetical protein